MEYLLVSIGKQSTGFQNDILKGETELFFIDTDIYKQNYRDMLFIYISQLYTIVGFRFSVWDILWVGWKNPGSRESGGKHDRARVSKGDNNEQ